VSKLALTVVTALGLLIVPALTIANPGDSRVVRGTLAWLPGTSGEPFAVVRADDGAHFVVDLSAAQSRGTVGVGDRVSVVGVEGARPYEIATVVIGAGDAAFPAAPPAALASPSASPPTLTPPATAPAAPTAPPAPERPWRRIDGRVQSISNATLTVRDAGGATVSVDVSRLTGDPSAVVRPGDDVTIFATTADGKDRLVAVGFVHAEPAPGSALPRAR
jgi:hypothetical protein